MDGVTMATQPTDTAKQQKTRGASDELAVIAQRAQAFTNASGVAIALAEGASTDEIICRARSGATAPEVGTALRVEGTFTGLCIASGKELRCDDAETDTRVDMAAIRALGIRSMVVTPIREDSRVVGVLAVFAPSAHAFTITHVAVLKTMADQISAAVQRERRAREDGVPSEPVRHYAPVAPAKPIAPASASSPAAPAPVLIKPAATAVTRPVAATPVQVKAEPVKVTPVAADIAIPLPAPYKREERPEVRASFGTLDTVAAEKQPGSNRMVLVGAAVLVVAAVSVFGILKLRKPSQPAQAQHQEAVNPAAPSQPAAASPVATTAQPSAETGSQPAPPNTARLAAKPAEPTKPAERNSARPAERAADKPEPAAPQKPSPATVALNNGPSHITTTNAQPSTDVAPASFSISTNSSGALNDLAKPTGVQTPTAVLAQSDFEPVQILKTVQPTYPIIAKVRRLSGTVTVQGKVGKDGRVTNLQFISGQVVFRDAAFDAVKQWVFKPATLNGQPIEQTTQVKLDFHP